MADEFVSDLDPNTTPASTDLLHIIDDVAGTPTDQKIVLSDLLGIYAKQFGAVADGATDDRTALFDANAEATISGATLVFQPGTYKVSSNLTFDADVGLRFEQGAVLKPDAGVTITINGPIDARARQQIFDLTNLTSEIDPTFLKVIYVGWWGVSPLATGLVNSAALKAITDGISNGTTGQNFGGAAPNIGAIPIEFGYGEYFIASKFDFPNTAHIYGQGRWATFITADAGFTGIMLQDKGNASKIIIRDLQIDANNEAAVTDLLNLGNLTTQWGTSGYAANLSLRGGDTVLNAGTTGLRHSMNVGNLSRIDVQYCDDGIIETANSVAVTYDGVSVLGAGATGRSMEVIRSVLKNIEIEAPEVGNVGIYVNRTAAISGLKYSQLSGVTNVFAIELDAAAQAFEMIGWEHLPTGGSVLTNVVKDNRASFPTNWGDDDAATKQVGIMVDSLHIGGNILRVRDYQLTNFKIRITNTAGTLQHRITSVGDATAVGKFQDTINAAKAALDNTPTGADASTAMAFGGKISSVNTNRFIFDTGDTSRQTEAIIWPPKVVFQDVATDLRVSMDILNRNVNSVTRKRAELSFTNALTGASFALTTGNITAGQIIDIIVTGCFAK